MAIQSADAVICGAGIAGISTAYQLAVKRGMRNILLVDERPPLSLTSDKSTECYRNWWPGPDDAMIRLMNRSIDILEELAHESDNAFHMNRRGYLFATADPARVIDMRAGGEMAAAMGAGPLRVHPGPGAYVPAAAQGFDSQITGSDLLADPALIQEFFPYLAKDTIAVLHARRCGWLSAQTLGMYLLERARECGVRFQSARVDGVDVDKNHIRAVTLSDGTNIATDALVIAAGPLLRQVGALIGIDLPVYCELHAKVSFKDARTLFPMSAPLLIWTDPQVIDWPEEVVQVLAESNLGALLEEFPSGVHVRPETGTFMGLWTYHTETVDPVFPPHFDIYYPEIVLRGLARMLPSLSPYLERPPRPVVDGGYYVKTRENRPLIGPLAVQGAYVIGALSGYGVMASAAAGELVAAHVAGAAMPTYAAAFALERYSDAAYRHKLDSWGNTGQL